VAEASASRCGYESYRCDLGTRPCPSGETCDVRMCDLTAGVCVPTPAACPTEGALRCTCVSEADPFGLAYANDCERLRAGAVLDVFRNPPFQICDPSCGGPDHLACAPPRTCVYPWGACSTLTQHGRCVEAPEYCPGPVCGCDGITYATECDADRAGVLVAYGGTCGTQCGGPPSFTCPPGLECLKEWGTCEQPDTWGVCRDVACLPLGEVCGCDGQLYPRPCDAIRAGTQVRGFPVDGECPRP